MRLFLASQDLGDFGNRLREMVGENRRALVVFNARDCKPERGVDKHRELLSEIGLEFNELDLRDYFGKKDDFYVNGGMFLGYLLNSKLTSKNSENDTDTTDMNKKIDAGLVFGFGKVFRLNDKNELKLEIRENLGLVNTSDVDVYNDGTIKTNSLNLILNWNFNL